VARLETDANGTSLARKLSRSDEKRVVVALSTESELGVSPIATLARVEGVGRDGGVIVSATGRVRVLEFDDSQAVPSARVEEIVLPPAQGMEVEALALEARRLARDILALLPAIPAEVRRPSTASRIRVPWPICWRTRCPPKRPTSRRRWRRSIRPRPPPTGGCPAGPPPRGAERRRHDIEGAVQQKVSKAEREHILRKKLEAIQKRAGRGPDSDKDELAQKLAALKLPEEVRSQVDKELARFKKLPEQSPERSVAPPGCNGSPICPGRRTRGQPRGGETRAPCWMPDHHGLQKVKKRVLQFLAVRKLRGDLRDPSSAWSGLPGVGKTSLGQSIARAMGRKFVRVSLGGVRDEAEIAGTGAPTWERSRAASSRRSSAWGRRTRW